MTQWWKNKIAYQIWPKSFCDGNGDGVGDLQGIIDKLDYLKELGVDIIWLSPIYKSPLVDQGYDISDYQKIHPLFGNMRQMKVLIREMENRQMYLIMDLVVNHCSSEHIWFKKACADPTSQYAKYFYIEKKGEKLPSNIRSYFGGSVWEELPGHPDYIYYHSFHKCQPDLNWENPMLRKEIYNMMNWWLDLGIAGFRVDAIMNIKKRLPFRDYPVDRDDGLSSIDNLVSDAKGIGEFLSEMKGETLMKYDAFTVGEVCTDDKALLEEFVGENGYFSSQFEFGPEGIGKHGLCHEFEEVTAESYKKAIFDGQRLIGNKGFLSNIIENHDESRGVSRYIPASDLSDTSKKALATIYFFLRGLPFIYQGQELGMENTTFDSIDEIDDVSTLNEYKNELQVGLDKVEALKWVTRYSRDNARTPVQWSDEEYAGFSTHEPWIKINSNYKEINLKKQRNDPESVYSYYREMIALRKKYCYEDVFVDGSFEPYLEEEKNLIAYFRKSEENTILVISNFQKDARTVTLPSENVNILLNNLGVVKIIGDQITLEGYQTLVLKIII